MRINTVGNKADTMCLVVRNADTVTIPLGTPVCLNMNGTNDGLDVVLPATGGAIKAHAFAYGVVINNGGVPVNGYGETQIFGVCNDVILVQQTRAASTVSWNYQATIPAYDILNIATAGNGMTDAGSSQAATQYLPFAILAASVASFASSTSQTSDTRTAITTMVKAFLRII